MTIRTTHIITGPLVLVVWVIDVYMLLVFVRLVADQLKGVCCDRLCQGLKSLTDPVQQTIHRKIIEAKGRNVPEWISWLIVMSAAFFIRHWTMWIIFSIG